MLRNRAEFGPVALRSEPLQVENRKQNMTIR
jgi:hypothetical protein